MNATAHLAGPTCAILGPSSTSLIAQGFNPNNETITTPSAPTVPLCRSSSSAAAYLLLWTNLYLL